MRATTFINHKNLQIEKLKKRGDAAAQKKLKRILFDLPAPESQIEYMYPEGFYKEVVHDKKGNA